MKTGKRFLSKFVLSGIGAAVLAGCSGGLIEAPNYKVHEVESFKVAGAPNRVMMIEVHDKDNLIPKQEWATTMSNHGYPPRLTFVTDPAEIDANAVIKPENRLVVVVNPSQGTMSSALCTSPESIGSDAAAERNVVRYGFCVGDKIVSELRARFTKEDFTNQVDRNADTVMYKLFPRTLNKTGDKHCSPMLPVC